MVVTVDLNQINYLNLIHLLMSFLKKWLPFAYKVVEQVTQSNTVRAIYQVLLSPN